MPERIPCEDELLALVGRERLDLWNALCAAIEESYDMERTWNSGGKKWVYETKYRRGGKTLCALYARQDCIGFMLIFGSAEREKFETIRESLSPSVCAAYDAAETYHDGKWIMFEPEGTAVFADYLRLLAIKRRPNRKRAEQEEIRRR